jgi:hypothetical protein
MTADDEVDDRRDARHLPGDVQLHARQRGLGVEQFADRVAALGQDQRLRRQVAQRDRRPQRLAARRPCRHQMQRLFAQRRDLQRRLRLRVVQHAEVDTAGGDPLGDVRRQPFDDCQPGAWQLTAESVDQRQRQRPAQARRQADHDAAGGCVALAAQLVARALRQLQHRDAVVEQAAPGFGQHDAAAVAQQQGVAQVGLERAHLA